MRIASTREHDMRPHNVRRRTPSGAAARVTRLQRTAGNRAVTLLVQRQRLKRRRYSGHLGKIDVCVEGEVPEPRSLADAIQRRQIDPDAPESMQHLPHFDFVEWLGTQDLEHSDRARLVEWSWEVHLEDLDRQRERNQQGWDLKRGAYGRGVMVPRDPRAFAPRRRRGQWLKVIVMGGVEYVVDLGRGVVHVGRYGKAGVKAIWDPSELEELAENDLAFFALVLSVFTDPVGVATKIATGYSAVFAANHYLTPEEQEQVKQAAAGAIPSLVEKLIGKQIAKKVVISLVVGPLIQKLAERVTNEIIKRGLAKAKGAPLLLLSVLGMLDKAHTAAKRLQKEQPLLYNYLKPDGLHIAWFLVEEPLKEVEKELEKSLAQQLGRPRRR